MATTTHTPERRCIGCRSRAPRAQLLRLVTSADGELMVDVRATMPGRGAWIHPDSACLALAERRRAFGRALRTSGPPDVAPVRDWIASYEAGRDGHEAPVPAEPARPIAKAGRKLMGTR
ncbi:YlxR family protein [Actinomyces gerencseriae]|uniref:YlxR family protein n=1 Tax=Actinomyces gerencseriae TaxID=52769 RepID=UPI0023F1B875|nr:YlxR family protein [Actinomyces gerencseriae]